MAGNTACYYTGVHMSEITATDSGCLLIHGTIVTYGRSWIPATPSNMTANQVGTITRCGGKPHLTNRNSNWVAFTVDQKDGSVDCFTADPSGRGVSYTVTVRPDGRKTEKQIIWAAGKPS